MGWNISTYMTIAGILSTVLFFFCVSLYSHRKEPLSKSSFIGILIFLLVLWAPLSYTFFYGALVETKNGYMDYKFVNGYIHTLNDKEKKAFMNKLISQKANIEKKYGLEWSYEKQESIDRISDHNPAYADPTKVEKYFNDDEYYFGEHWYVLATIIYLVAAYKISRRLKIHEEHFLGEIKQNRKNGTF